MQSYVESSAGLDNCITEAYVLNSDKNSMKLWKLINSITGKVRNKHDIIDRITVETYML